MKKIIIISILAVSVILLFSGCDAILEAMFPDETGHGDKSGDNFITLNIDIDKSIDGWWNSEIWVELQGVNGTQFYDTRHDFAWDDGNPDNPAHIDLSFDFLPDGEYMTNVWLDKNGNGQADNEEPFAQVMTDYGTTFPMPYPDPQDPNNPDKQNSEMSFPVQLGTMNIGAMPIVVMGEKTININDKNSLYSYNVAIAKDGYGIGSFDWKVNNQDSMHVEGWSFQTDFSSFGEGIAMLYLDNIKASDGQTEITIPHYEEPVRIVEEPSPGADYKISVNSWGFDMPPWNLNWNASYNVRVELFDHNHNYLYFGHNYTGALKQGGFSISSDGTDMGPMRDGFFYYSTAANGTDIIRVYVDMDGNGGATDVQGYRDDDDLVFESEIGLSINLDYNDGTYLWRDFYFDPFRFMKEKDFHLVYPN